MAKLIQVRELKNQTTQLLRHVERGTTLVVTRRGKPVATLKKFETSDLEHKPQHNTALWDHLSSRIAKRHPQIKTETVEQARREFERLTKKAGAKRPFKFDTPMIDI